MSNKESYFASLHILMRAILMAQRTLAAGFTDTGIEEAAAKSTPAGKYKISVNPVILSNFSSCLLCLFVAKNPLNLRNPWLINDLRAFGIFTLVEESLQINSFMQNKAKFRKSQMNVNKVLTKDYEKRTLGGVGKTNPKRTQTNPKRTQLKPISKRPK